MAIAPVEALDVSHIIPSENVIDVSRDRVPGVMSGICSDTLTVHRNDLQTTFAVKVKEICPEDQAALLRAVEEGIVDLDAPPDH